MYSYMQEEISADECVISGKTSPDIKSSLIYYDSSIMSFKRNPSEKSAGDYTLKLWHLDARFSYKILGKFCPSFQYTLLLRNYFMLARSIINNVPGYFTSGAVTYTKEIYSEIKIQSGFLPSWILHLMFWVHFAHSEDSSIVLDRL